MLLETLCLILSSGVIGNEPILPDPKLAKRTENEWICPRCHKPAEGHYCARCGQPYERPKRL